MAFLCIDIGGTNTLFGIGNGDFEEVRRVKTKEFLEDVEGTVDSVLDNYSGDDISSVAVAAAGPVDAKKGLFYPPNIDQDVVHIRERLESYGSVEIVNDCAAAVLGEYHYGETSESLLYVTMSSGIGAAYIENGKLVQGETGNFGEVGHMKLGNQLKCGCGGTGHWEAYCSGENIPQMAKQFYDLKIDYAKDLFEKENPEAEKALEKFREKTGEGIINLINMYNPGKIVFGGAVALNHFNHIEKSVENIGDELVNDMPEITLSGLGDNSVLHGLRAKCNQEV